MYILDRITYVASLLIQSPLPYGITLMIEQQLLWFHPQHPLASYPLLTQSILRQVVGLAVVQVSTKLCDGGSKQQYHKQDFITEDGGVKCK